MSTTEIKNELQQILITVKKANSEQGKNPIRGEVAFESTMTQVWTIEQLEKLVEKI